MFGDNLKKYRQLRGYSQKEIADKLYVTRQCISKWEKGTTQPDLDMLTRISKLLDVSIDELVSESFDASINKAKPNLNRNLFAANMLAALFCVFAYVAMWRCLPKTIPAHWTNGVIDRYGDCIEILLHIVTVVVFFFIDLILFYAFNKVINRKIILVIHLLMIAFQLAYLIFIAVMYVKYLISVLSFVACLASALIMCLSVAMHPKISRQNQWFGVRTCDTLSNEAVWNKTNKFACYLFVFFSLAIFIINLIVVAVWSCICLIAYIVPTVAVFVYSMIIAKRVNSNH